MGTNYESSIDFVVDGLEACLRNARRLTDAAEGLLQASPALALSVGTLSLEELGKLLFVDGLLVSAPGDYKSKAFKEGRRLHRSKLFSLIRFLWSTDWFATLDPTRTQDAAFLRAVHDSKVEWNEARKALAPWLGVDAPLDALDVWKQRGFYTDVSGSRFVQPDEVVPPDFGRGVVRLARLTIDMLDWLLTPNLGKYRDIATLRRARMTEADRKALTQAAGEFVKVTLDNARKRHKGA